MEFFSHIHFKGGNGRRIKFWDDTCFGDRPLKEVLHFIYFMTRFKEISVMNCFEVYNDKGVNQPGIGWNRTKLKF